MRKPRETLHVQRFSGQDVSAGGALGLRGLRHEFVQAVDYLLGVIDPALGFNQAPRAAVRQAQPRRGLPTPRQMPQPWCFSNKEFISLPRSGGSRSHGAIHMISPAGNSALPPFSAGLLNGQSHCCRRTQNGR